MAGLLPTWAWMLIWLAVVILYGLVGLDMNQSLYEASINTLGYVMMALGLNIVVGFAGLLDLGYVAFYAIGAFVFGWLASGHFRGSEIYIGVPEKLTLSGDVQPGIHINIFIILVGRGRVHGAVGRDPGRTDAAAARRLPGDRDAGVRRDRAARVRVLDSRARSGSATSISPTAARGSRRSTCPTCRGSSKT